MGSPPLQSLEAQTVKRPSAALRLASACALVVGIAIPGWAATAAPVAAASATDWPMYLHDGSLDAASSETILSPTDAPNLRPTWTFKTGGVIAASATVVGGVAYVGSWDGFEYALNAATGALIWKTNLGITTAPACSPPSLGVSSVAAVTGGVVYVGGGDSNWYALNASTGAVLWTVPTGDNSAAGGHYNWASPLIVGNSAYIGIASLGDCPLVQGQLLRVDLTSHLVVASVNFVPTGQVGGGVWTTPAIDTATNTVYVTTGTRNMASQTTSEAMVALDATTLAIKSYWQIPLSAANADSDWGDSPILFNDGNNRPMVAGINKNGFLYAFDRTNLALGPIWSEQVAVGGICPTCGDASVASMAYAGGLLFVGGGNTTIGGNGYPGALRAINPTTGAVVWEHGLADPVIPALAADNGMVFAGSGSRLEVFDAASGARLYSYSTGAVIYAPPSISGGIVYIGSGNGNEYAFAPVTPVAPPADPNCPAGFVCQDIGTPSPAGSETVSSGSWAISAGGAGIGGTADQFRFMSQTAAGDLGLRARVSAETVAGTGTQAGLMVRAASDPGSPFYALTYAGGNSLAVTWRTAFGGATTTVKVTAGALPQYLQIQRIGDGFSASSSTNGSTYTLVAGSSATLTMPGAVMAGLAATSGVNGTAAASSVDSVVLGAPGAAPSPAAPASACPSGWSCADVGNPATVGDQSLSSGTWTIKGAGTASANNIYTDQFHLVWQALGGDGTLSARIATQPNTAAGAQAGLEFRANATDPGAVMYGAFVTPTKGLQVVYRSGAGLRTTLVLSTAGAAPAYLEISRYGNTYTTFGSTDGINWTALVGSSVTFGAGGAMVAGLIVNSGATGTLAVDTLDSVSLTGSAAPPPSLCPTGWTCADIGFPTPGAGSQYVIGPNTSVTAGGSDIWGTYDAFRLLSQPLAGDGTFSARVDAQTNTSAWAKAGVMIRASSDPGSPYFAEFVTPGNGVAVQWRTTQGGASSQVSTPGTVPAWFQISRAGSTYTAYTSADGVTWTPVPGASVTLTMPGTLLAGLAVTSHNGGAMGTATFDTPTLTNTVGIVTSGATYHALTPTRLLDTRDGTGGLSGPLSSHAAETFMVTGGVVPANATAVTGNLTVTGQTSGGFLFLGPSATNNPTSSTLNFPVGDDRANAVTVALGTGGTLSVTFVAPHPGPTAFVIFDVTGYFTPDTSGAFFVPLSPARILDTRDGTGGLSGPLGTHAAATFAVGGHGRVSTNAIAVTGNLTVTGQTSNGFLFLGPSATNNPTSSTLNFPVGDDRANAVTVALSGSGGSLSVTFVAPTSGPTTQVVFDVSGYFVP
jgi:outer membrane protein assembly factor BamB